MAHKWYPFLRAGTVSSSPLGTWTDGDSFLAEWTPVLRIYLKTLLEKKSELLLTFWCYSEGNRCPETGGSFPKPLGLFIEETDLNQMLLGLPPKTWWCDFGLLESWKKEGGSPAPTCLSKLTACCLPGKPSLTPPPPLCWAQWPWTRVPIMPQASIYPSGTSDRGDMLES